MTLAVPSLFCRDKLTSLLLASPSITSFLAFLVRFELEPDLERSNRPLLLSFPLVLFIAPEAPNKSPDFRKEIGRFWAIPPKLGENSENWSCWEACPFEVPE